MAPSALSVSPYGERKRPVAGARVGIVAALCAVAAASASGAEADAAARAELAAEAAAVAAAIRDAAIAGAAAGLRPRVTIDVGGASASGRILSADGVGLAFSAGGSDVSIGWEALNARSLLSVGRAFFRDDDEPARARLARFCMAHGLVDEARLEAGRAAGPAVAELVRPVLAWLERLRLEDLERQAQAGDARRADAAAQTPRAPASRGPWPFDPVPLELLRRSPKKVFAHYFSPFPISIDNREPEGDYYARGYLDPEGERGKHRAYGGYLRQRPLGRPPRPGADWAAEDMAEEVRRASALGLDGFAFDILSTRGVHRERLQLVLDAARRVDPGFAIVLMPDMEAEFRDAPERVVEIVAELAAHPSLMRLPDGRLVVAPYNAQNRSAEWWKQTLAQLETRGVKVALVPLFQGWPRYAKEYAPVSYGMSDWGPRWPSGAAALRGDARRAHEFAPVWMAPVAPQDFRPKSFVYWEAAGSLSYRTMWESAIEGGADWAHVITWNDYSEGSEIAPSTATGYSFYDLTAYYVAWFKTGAPPPIVRDVLYYFHRVHAAAAPADAAKQARAFVCKGDAARDEVELVAFLARPGEIQIELAGKLQTAAAPAGVTVLRMPLVPGRPVFRLIRGREKVVEVQSRWEINATVVYSDLLYHGGCSSRDR